MIAGSVFFDEEFEFHDGESGEKLFVVLGTVGSVSVVAKTTSRQHGRGVTFGCQPSDRFPNFFIPPRVCAFRKATWVCLDEFYELKSAVVLKKRYEGIIKPVCTIIAPIMRQIQDCALASEDITPNQEVVVRACLITAAASP